MSFEPPAFSLLTAHSSLLIATSGSNSRTSSEFRGLAISGNSQYTITMKQVVAIVKPYLAEKVLDSLKDVPLHECNVREVKGYGRQKSYLDEYRGSEYSMAFLPKVEITLWVDDALADEVIGRVVEVARTGRVGDGKLFVLPAIPAGAAED